MEVECGMNIFVYCSDNFGGGYLEIKLLGGQTLQIVTPPTLTGGGVCLPKGGCEFIDL